jgi:hypothetical protein
MADLDEIMAGARGRASGDEGQQRDPAQEAAAEPVQGQPQPEAPPQPEGDPDPVKGLKAALDDERSKRRLYKEHLDAVNQRLAGMEGQFNAFMQAFQAQQRPQGQEKPPAPPPDWWENPDAALDFRLRNAVEPVAQDLRKQVEQAQQAVSQQREQFSRMMAVQQHGEEAVNTAYQSLAEQIRSNPQGAEHEWRRIMSSPHPFDALVQWHKAATTLQEIGQDPAAYREKLKQELMAELQAQQPASAPQAGGAAPQPQRAMPSNFATTRSAGTRGTPQTTGPRPLSEIMGR